MLLKKYRNHTNALPSVFANELNGFFNDDFFGHNQLVTQPSVNIREQEEEYHIELAAPGMEKPDFNVDVDHDLLTISVEKEQENTEEHEGYTRREFNYGSFKRSFNLPDTVDAEKIKATYNNGILQVVLPKKAEVKKAKRTIKIS